MNATKKKKTKGILWLALGLGLLMPFGLYVSLQNGQTLPAILFFLLLSGSYLLTAWKA